MTPPRPQPAIDARRRDATTKAAAVDRAVQLLGRSGEPISRAAVARLAGVSRSFTDENEHARTVINAGQSRTRATAASWIVEKDAESEASWRERDLNAEDHLGKLRNELSTQKRLVTDLIGHLREPDGTWLQHDRARLRHDNTVLLDERNRLTTQRDALQRRLDGARANVSRLNEHRVSELFPNGPHESTTGFGVHRGDNGS